MLRRQSLFRPFQLKGNGGVVQDWSAGGQIQFNMNNLPLLTDGDKANYLVALAVTVFGEFTSDGGGTARPVSQADLCRGLLLNFEIQGAWHGRPIAAQHVRGATLPIIERIGCGYQAPSRQIAVTSQSETPKSFRFTQYLPLGHYVGENPQYTAQLAALFTDSYLQINCTTGATFTDSNGNVLTWDVAGDGRVQVVCSAILLPEKAIRLAPGMEWLQFQQPAVNNNVEVTLDSLGNTTALEGIEPGAGIDTMLALTSVRGQLGSFTLDQVINFSAPLAGITQTSHIDPFVQLLEQASTEHGRPMNGYVAEEDGNFAGYLVDGSEFPYTAAGGSTQGLGTRNEALLDPQGLCLPILVAGTELQTSKVKIFEGTQSYYRTLNGNPAANSQDITLIHQYKSWQPAKVEDFRQLVISKGLALAVLGTKDIGPVAAVDNLTPSDPRKGRFFPIEFKPAAKPA